MFFVLFSLAWPQYPPVIAGVFLVLLVGFLSKKLNLSLFFRCLALLIFFGVIGHLICIHLIGTAYSPITFLKEAYLGMVNYRLPEIKLAIGRSDWRSLDIPGFGRNFGYFMLLLVPAGLIFSLAKLKELKYLAIVIFSCLALAVTFIFTKSRYLALSPLLFLSVAGAEFFWESENIGRILRFIKNLCFSLGFIFRKGIAVLARNRNKFIAAAIAVLIIGAGIYIILVRQVHLPPAIELQFLKVPESLDVGKEYPVTIQIRNVGGDSLKEEKAIGGLHIEVENAEVKHISAPSTFTRNEIAMKIDFQRGNVFWFEVKFGKLKSNETSAVSFVIVPRMKPVKIYYRAWLPDECSRQDRLAILKELRPAWHSWENTWRSENCIKRLPANGDLSSPSCLIEVYAAHQELQDFNCLKKELK